MINEMRNNIIEAFSDFIVEEYISDKTETRYDFEHPLMADDYYMEIVYDKVADKYKVETHFSGKIVFPGREVLKTYSSWALNQYDIYYEEEYGEHRLETGWLKFEELGVKVRDMIKVANDFSNYSV